ncbi:MAG: TIGR03084 family protein [Rhodobacterales bacterium]|nr:MAG: TIGR03084 family protein [Rhodobacterales bacterium]
MQAATDLREEIEVLSDVVTPLSQPELDRETLFKGWSVEDILGHLHMFDVAALKALQGPELFAKMAGPILAGMKAGKTFREMQYEWLDGLSGVDLRAAWYQTAVELADGFAARDPKDRVQWFGPGMSVQSAATARQMEVWAHGQAVFDLLGLRRKETDRIRNIAHLGVVTYGWSFACRGQEAPEPAPHVRLIAPSGAVWEWNETQDDNRVEGHAVEFAQVVAQTRNVADTGLKTVGDAATRWMATAQCFAGPPSDPPLPGARHISGG